MSKQQALDLLDQALTWADNLPHETNRCDALAVLAAHYAGIGCRRQARRLFSRALRLARRTGDPQQKLWRLTTLAKQTGIGGREKTALRLLAAAGKLALTMGPSYEISPELSAVAEGHTNLGHFTPALETAAAIDDDYLQAEALTAIAESYSRAHNDALLLNILAIARTLALTNARRLDDGGDYPFLEILVRIAAIHAAGGRQRQVTAGLAEATAIAEAITYPTAAAQAKRHLAAGMAACGRLDQALAMAETIPASIPEERQAARLALVTEYCKIPRPDAALSLAASMTPDLRQVTAFCRIAACHHAAGRRQEARQTADRALAAADLITTEEEQRSRALAAVAVEYAGAGRRDLALPLLEQARSLADCAVRVPLLQQLCLGEIARGYAAAGDFTAAARTAAAIGREPERINTLAEIALTCFQFTE